MAAATTAGGRSRLAPPSGERLPAERALALFLEVDETNVPALALYRRLRFEEVGRRPAYYPGPDGQRTSALIMKRTLRG